MPEQERPNLVVVMSDQHNPRVLGCAGDPVIRTPHLDRLAAAGRAVRADLRRFTALRAVAGHLPHRPELFRGPGVVEQLHLCLRHPDLRARPGDCRL